MTTIYKTNENGQTIKTDKIEKGSWINVQDPTIEEITQICSELDINEDFFKYTLDSEEQARIDVEEDSDTILYIIDTPVLEEMEKSKIYTTMPMGVMIVKDDYIITISLKENEIIKSIEKDKKIITYKKSRILLQILYNNAKVFLETLKKINKESEMTESLLQSSMKNEAVLKMLNLEKSLVYLTTALKANELVMEKTMRGKTIKLYEEDEDILEDAIIENKQAIEMSQIYSNILGTTMEAYSSIISNNLNGVMKILTSITIIIAIPTLIASFWGMNVPVPFEKNNLGFAIMIVISILLGLIATIWLKKKDMLN